MSDPILQFSGVSKSFGGLKVLEDVSFDLKPGQRFGLIGPNGAGKTTVFNILSGVYPVDSGSIILAGQNITDLPIRERIGLGLSRSFQNIRLMPHLSVIENVLIGQHCQSSQITEMLKPINWLKGNKWRRRAMEMIENAGLEVDPGSTVAELPYGVRKKIEVVRALMSEPSVLMLDEPAAGLNSRETSELADFLHEISNRNVTLLLVEHDMNFIHALCERVAVLNFGSKIFEGTPKEVNRDKAVLEAYLGTAKLEASDAS